MRAATRIFVCVGAIWCLLPTICESVRAEEDAFSANLYRKQQEAFEQIWAADANHDFAKQLSLLKQVRELTVAGENDAKLYGVAELDFFARDLERALLFSAEELQLCDEELAKRRQALVSGRLADFDSAADQLEGSLELCKRLYGEKSYRAVCMRLDLANAILRSDANLDKGIVAACEVADICTEQGLEEGRLYADSQVALTRLYWKRRNHDLTLESGLRAMALLEKLQLQSTHMFVELAGVVASEKNRKGRFEEALKLATKGRTIAATMVAPNSALSYRLTAEAARAQWGLQRREEAILEYSLLEIQTEENAWCSAERRLEYLSEFAEALKVLGDKERLAQVLKKSERIKSDAQDRVLPKVQKSRYSN